MDLLSFARLCLEETKVDGVHPSLEPTVLKYLWPPVLVMLYSKPDVQMLTQH